MTTTDITETDARHADGSPKPDSCACNECMNVELGTYEDPPTCPICDGIHGALCPIESPDPAYYADEMAAGR